MPEDRERETMDDGHDDGNIPGLPPFPEGMPEEMKQQLREAHENGGLGGLLLGAILGRLMDDPDENMRKSLRRAMDLSPEETNKSLRFAVATAVREDGSELLLSSALLQDDNDKGALAESRDFLQKIVRPILRPGEGARVRIVDLGIGAMIERASDSWNLAEFEEHVLLMQADSEFEARVRKFEECQDCEVEDCDDRITECPTRDDEPAE
jgi:hypothetical protein